jgi:hypothetical protein
VRLPYDVVDRLARPRAGTVLTSELVALGADYAWITRQVDSRRWQRLHRGVLVTYSGPMSWRSHAWAALLYAGAGAALSHDSAAAWHEFRPPRRGPVHVTVPAERRVRPTAGVVLHRARTMPPASGRPRRVWRGDTTLDLVAAAASVDDAVGWMCDAVRAGTAPLEIVHALDRRPNVRRAALARELLVDVGAGVESPLERRYHRDVERRHGLPPSRLQQREVIGGLWIRADVVYVGLGVRVELDGALAHPGGRTDLDTWRDNAVLIALGDLTLRYRWPHVVDPCPTAVQVTAALRRRGWPGDARPCSTDCVVGAR